MNQKSLVFLESTYDRVVKVDLPPLLIAGDEFALIDGYYHNPGETIVFKSTAETGKYFYKKASAQNVPTKDGKEEIGSN